MGKIALEQRLGQGTGAAREGSSKSKGGVSRVIRRGSSTCAHLAFAFSGA